MKLGVTSPAATIQLVIEEGVAYASGSTTPDEVKFTRAHTSKILYLFIGDPSV